MNINVRHNGLVLRERASALLVAATVTFLTFAAINAGFTPHGAYLAGQVNSHQPALTL